MLQLIMGFVISQAVRAAAGLQIADHLADGPKSAKELAPLVGAHAGSLHRLLRGLASIGVFTERDGGAFALTPMAEHLKREGAESVWPAAMFMVDAPYLTAHELITAVRTGEGNFDKVFGQSIFDYIAARPGLGAIFDRMMTSFHGPETPAIAAAYDFSSFGRIVDVGGGNGEVLKAILAANPKVKGTLFDLPDVTARAKAALASDATFPRFSFETGDFFKAVAGGGDAYILRHIIHDWNDEESVAILTRCREAMGAKGRLLVIEEIIPDGNTPAPAKWLDVLFLAAWTGKERTKGEYDDLYTRAGFKLTAVVPTASAVSIVEGAPA
jgi:hypothetical protein